MIEYRYPYMPEGRHYLYAPQSDPIMRLAIRYAHKHSLDRTMPTAVIITRNHQPIALGSNGSDFHQTHGCARRDAGSSTGKDYHLCEGCHPKNHSESRAIDAAQENRVDLRNASLYLWGHFGCCRSCWPLIIEADIGDVFLLTDAEVLFNKNHPDNIVGAQFGYFQSYL